MEGSPFRIVSIEGKWFLAIGQHRITDFKNSEEELMEWVETNKWNMVTQLVMVVADALYEEKISNK